MPHIVCLIISASANVAHAGENCHDGSIRSLFAGMPDYRITEALVPWSDESWIDHIDASISVFRFLLSSDHRDKFRVTAVCSEDTEEAENVFRRYTLHESSGGTPTDLVIGDSVIAFGPKRLLIRWGSLNVAIIADHASETDLAEFVKAIDMRITEP